MMSRFMVSRCCCAGATIERGGEIYEIADPTGSCSLTADPVFGCKLGQSGSTIYWFGLRVPSVNVANGATIDSASMGISVTRGIGLPTARPVTIEYWLGSDFVANTTNFCSGGSWVTLGTRTLSASIAVNQLDVQAAVDAITGLPGWTSGNAMGFRLSPAWTPTGSADYFGTASDTAGIGLDEWTLTVATG